MLSKYLISVSIIVFWAVMTFLFVQKEIAQALPKLAQPSYEAYLKRPDYEKEVKMGIYFREQKIGTTSTTINQLENKFIQIINQTLIDLPHIFGRIFGMKLPGTNNMAMQISGETIIDHKYQLKTFNLAVKSPFLQYNISGEVKGSNLEFTILDGQKKVSQNLRYNPHSTISDGLSPFVSMPYLTVGKEWTIHFISPFSPSIQTLKAKVEGFTSIEWNGKIHNVYEVVLTDPKMSILASKSKYSTYTAYITEDGKILKQEILLPGFYLIRE
jgi:hypothetical protein